jgi:serine/threonine protein kinase
MGTFGRVLAAVDIVEDSDVAVKAVRAIRRYTESARVEASILSRVMANRGRPGGRLIVRFHESFMEGGHLMLVFERLGLSVYDYSKRAGHVPLPLRTVREVSAQMLGAIAFLHDMRLIHTDLKPENVMLRRTEFVESRETTAARDGATVLRPRDPQVRREWAGRGAAHVAISACLCASSCVLM